MGGASRLRQRGCSGAASGFEDAVLAGSPSWSEPSEPLWRPEQCPRTTFPCKPRCTQDAYNVACPT